ncbi:MBG domain-containing protein, partial [Lactobacillus intestinalis]|uniref:MBG domain-containing protein n=2 Tax=Lactobacillus intestinalis TaxID=151781 RepID=UPI0026EB8A32
VKDKDGKTVDPTDVGDYTVYLTPAAIQKLEKLNPNYNWPTTEQKVGTLTIIPAVMDITLSGNGSKVSDGQPAKVELSTLVDNLTGNNLNKDGLTLADFSWNTPDGNAPSEVGNYTITLNEKGLKKLQADNSNYTVNVSGEFKYTITAAHQKIEYVDGNGNVIKTIENIGTALSNYGDKVDFNVKQNVPKDYKLVNSNVPTQITIENGVTRFVVEKIEDEAPIEPPTPNPSDDHETDKDDTSSGKPDLPIPDKKPNRPTPDQKEPSKPSKSFVPSDDKKTGEGVSPKYNNGGDKENSSKADAIRVGVLNKVNTASQVTGTKHTRLPNGIQQVNSRKNAHILPQTGSRKENFSFIVGILAIGLGLLGLGNDRRNKK